MSFARIETNKAPEAAPLELIFATGERLRVAKGADAATLVPQQASNKRGISAV